MKKLTKFDIMSLVMGSIIGWGSFSLPGNKFLTESGVINTALGFLVGGISVVFIQKGYHIMMKEHGEDGGEFSYTYNNLGRGHGFIVGWSLILCYLSMIPLNATAFILVLKNILGDSISQIYLYTIAGKEVYLTDIIISAIIILLFAYINKIGLHLSSLVQNIMVSLLVINVFILLIYMAFYGNIDQFNANYIINSNVDILQMSKIIAIVPFLFVGFDVVPQVATDLSFSPKKATTLTIISIFIGVIVYSSLNTITALAYTPEQASSLNWATGSAVYSYAGIIGFGLLIIALIGAVTGGINGFMISSSKIIASLSSYKLFPSKYQEKNYKNVLSNAINFITIISLIAPFFGREVIIMIVDMSSLLASIAYAYVCFISFRYAKNMKDKILDIVGFIVCIVFIGLLVLPNSPSRLSLASFSLLFAWVLLGIFYYIRSKKNI